MGACIFAGVYRNKISLKEKALPEIGNEYFPLKDETDAIIHLGFEVYNELGFGFWK